MGALDPEKTKSAFPILEARILDVLVEYDPSGFYGMGAPRDEHESDAHAIISALQEAHDLEDVARILEERLTEWIEGRGDIPDVHKFCAEMAPKVWRAWRAFREDAAS